MPLLIHPSLHPGFQRRVNALLRRSRHSPDNGEVRSVVRLRGGDAREYCLLPTNGAFNIDHVIPPDWWDVYRTGQLEGVPYQADREGPNHIDNYAWACGRCDNRKRAHAVLRTTSGATRPFDPCLDRWPDHFVFWPSSGYLLIEGMTPEGEATVEVLGFNDGGLGGPLGPRHVAIVHREYPPGWARIAYGLDS